MGAKKGIPRSDNADLVVHKLMAILIRCFYIKAEYKSKNANEISWEAHECVPADARDCAAKAVKVN